MKKGKLKAIIFDSEGVVIDTEPIWDLSQHEFLSRRGLSYDREKIKPRLTGKSMDDGSRAMKEFYCLDGEIEALNKERREIISTLFASKVDYIPGFVEFHHRFVSSVYPSCIATAMEPALFHSIDARLKLSDIFANHIYFIADVNYRSKPDPAIFCHAAEKLGIPCEDCLVIEDSPAGIGAAINAGMHCVALTTTFPAKTFEGKKVDLVAKDYAEIGSFLESYWQY